VSSPAALWVAAALLCCGCPTEKPAARLGLRVPLPDGWVATPRGAALEAGPAGRAVVTLESRTSALPPLEQLLAALETEGVQVQEKASEDSYVGARYQLGLDGGVDAGQPEGFVAVKKVGERTVWCASAAQATAEQVRAGFALCRAVGLEPGP